MLACIYESAIQCTSFVYIFADTGSVRHDMSCAWPGYLFGAINCLHRRPASMKTITLSIWISSITCVTKLSTLVKLFVAPSLTRVVLAM